MYTKPAGTLRSSVLCCMISIGLRHRAHLSRRRGDLELGGTRHLHSSAQISKPLELLAAALGADQINSKFKLAPSQCTSTSPSAMRSYMRYALQSAMPSPASLSVLLRCCFLVADGCIQRDTQRAGCRHRPGCEGPRAAGLPWPFELVPDFLGATTTNRVAKAG
jgi:hypothetical protein